MILGKKVVVTMPAYFAEKTVGKTVAAIPRDIVDTIILVDDCSKDNTTEAAKALGIEVFRNETNKNYGGNVKRCLQEALDAGADIVIQLHPDFQYPPGIVAPMAAILATGHYDFCLGARLGGRKDTRVSMPFWRLLPNRILTHLMDLCLGTKHTEYHTGMRGYTRELLETVKFHELSNHFIFDNEMFIGALKEGFRSCEVSCPTVYEEDSSSISFQKAMRYGSECLKISFAYWMWRLKTGGVKPRGV
jgi:glycosyltransferase involved in cell wall biosynthesis